ncbi:MAG: alpha/beta hydrolase [Candidatus Gastranaerophilales bacterium]|nr:alpha/beta hydrolase [Candidatus Gastranaerophilales bacterium]
MEEIKLKTQDGITIAINQYKSGFNSVIIIAPGWFMTKDSKVFKEISEIFAQNFDVITMDFRGHGRSSGVYTFTQKETFDIQIVIDYAKAQYKKIYLAGFSLGAAIILNAAANNENKTEKIIAVSAPTCFNKIENKFWKKEAWLPTLKKFEPQRWLSIRPSLPFSAKTKTIDIIDSIHVPTLFIAGSKDPIVYPWHTEALFNKAACTKEYKVFENCAHAEDIFLQNKTEFIQTCLNWFLV